MLDNPRSPFVHLKFPFKFCVDRVRTFRDIAIRKFYKFGLKCLFRLPIIMFWGSFDPKTLFFIIEAPNRPYRTRKHAFWAINGRYRSSGVTCSREQEYKKGWNTKINGKCPPYAKSLPVVPHQPNFAFGSYPGYLSWLQVSLRAVEKCGSCWGSKFRPSHLLGTSLIQQLVAIAQAVMSMSMSKFINRIIVKNFLCAVHTSTVKTKTSLTTVWICLQNIPDHVVIGQWVPDSWSNHLTLALSFTVFEIQRLIDWKTHIFLRHLCSIPNYKMFPSFANDSLKFCLRRAMTQR